MMKYKTLVIGIDQSYSNTGISICCDGVLKKVSSLWLDKLKTNSEKRQTLRNKLTQIIETNKNKADNIICVIERIRLISQKFLNIDYIKSIGALNSIIVDVCFNYNIPVYSVDTRCWKSQVIGTSKPQNNNYGVPPEKWPTVKYIIDKGFKDSLLVEITTRKTKGTFTKNNKKYMFNNDAADSAGIALFYFVGDKNKLKAEK